MQTYTSIHYCIFTLSGTLRPLELQVFECQQGCLELYIRLLSASKDATTGLDRFLRREVEFIQSLATDANIENKLVFMHISQ